jgi:hypothetical protein
MDALVIDQRAELRLLAKRSLKRHTDVQAATDAMQQKVMSDPRLYRVLLDPLVRAACYDLVTAECRKANSIIWNMPQPSHDERKGDIAALAQGTVDSLLEFRLLGRKPLKDANKQDILEVVSAYRSQSKTMAHIARWLEAIAAKLDSDDVVKDKFNAAQLAALKQKVRK